MVARRTASAISKSPGYSGDDAYLRVLFRRRTQRGGAVGVMPQAAWFGRSGETARGPGGARNGSSKFQVPGFKLTVVGAALCGCPVVVSVGRGQPAHQRQGGHIGPPLRKEPPAIICGHTGAFCMAQFVLTTSLARGNILIDACPTSGISPTAGAQCIVSCPPYRVDPKGGSPCIVTF